MKISIETLKAAYDKIAALTSGDKTIPGVMFNIYAEEDSAPDENGVQSGKMDVCYNSGKKAFIETVSVEIEEGDRLGKMVVSFEKLGEAISKCMSKGSIKVDNVHFQFIDKIIRIKATQYMCTYDENGEVANAQTVGRVETDLLGNDVSADKKTELLNRMDYNSIFNPVGTPDEYDRTEFVDILGRVSVEKGRNIYVSGHTHSVFVQNQAHLTSVPVSLYDELSDDEITALKSRMVEAGKTDLSPEAVEAEALIQRKRVHSSLVIPQQIAKALATILGKCDSDEIKVHVADKIYCNVVAGDNDEERVGIWFEMASPNKTQTETFKIYESTEYTNYQITFIKDVLELAVRNATSSSTNDKTALMFKDTKLEDAVMPISMFISGSNSIASVKDEYEVNLDDLAAPVDDLKDKQFTISLKVFSDMLAQIKTPHVAFDINISENRALLRLAEIDEGEQVKQYTAARAKLAEDYAAQGKDFDPNSTPTPFEYKAAFRKDVLKCKQYTTIVK